MHKCPYAIEQVLPHAHPMILLDEIVGIADDGIDAVVTIHEDEPFFRSEGIPAHVAIEYMAQACGAFVGVEALSEGRAPQVGLLLGSRNFTARRRWFVEGERLLVHVEVVYREDEMGVFDCRVTSDRGSEPLASARLTVYQPAEGSAMKSSDERAINE